MSGLLSYSATCHHRIDLRKSFNSIVISQRRSRWTIWVSLQCLLYGRCGRLLAGWRNGTWTRQTTCHSVWPLQHYSNSPLVCKSLDQNLLAKAIQFVEVMHDVIYNIVVPDLKQEERHYSFTPLVTLQRKSLPTNLQANLESCPSRPNQSRDRNLLLVLSLFDSVQLSEKLTQQLLKTLSFGPTAKCASGGSTHLPSCSRLTSLTGWEKSKLSALSVASGAWSHQSGWHQNSSDFDHRTLRLSSLVARTQVSQIWCHWMVENQNCSRTWEQRTQTDNFFSLRITWRKSTIISSANFTLGTFQFRFSSMASESVSSSGGTSSKPSHSSPWKKKMANLSVKTTSTRRHWGRSSFPHQTVAVGVFRWRNCFDVKEPSTFSRNQRNQVEPYPEVQPVFGPKRSYTTGLRTLF